MAIYRGDDTAAFNGTFITINLTVPTGQTISQAKFKVGDLPAMVFNNPTFPLTVNLDETQTAQLQDQNTCYLAVWDSQNRKKTCKGTLKFVTKDAVVE